MLNSLCADKIGLEQDAWQADGAQLSTYTALVLQEQG
jgi:hypothetical protein